MTQATIVTVTFNSWFRFTDRLIRMVEHYTPPEQVHKWIFCDNASEDTKHLRNREFKLPVHKVYAEDNIGDLPRYNTLFSLAETEIIVVISPDCRIFDRQWLDVFIQAFTVSPRIGLVGVMGPGEGLTAAQDTPETGGAWHWVAKVLTERNIPFDHAGHIQTHAFAVRKQAFEEAGGFWTCEVPFPLHKGDCIAGEVSFSSRIRQAGWQLHRAMPRLHHYGSAAVREAQHEEYDRSRGWPIEF